MSIVATLLDKARTGRGFTSDNALASALGQHRQTISQWRHGESYPSEENIVALAEMAKDDPLQWLVAIKAVRAEGKAGKVWAALARRLATAAMTLALGVGLASPRDAQAAMGHSASDSVYIMRNGVRQAEAALAVEQVSPCQFFWFVSLY